MRFAPSLTLQRALLASTTLALLAGIIPAGVVLDRQLAAALEARARADLELAPRVLADRSAASADAMMMHAKELSHVPQLADALARGDRAALGRALDASRALVGEALPVVVGPKGESLSGPPVSEMIVAMTRAGQMPVAFAAVGNALHTIALAPVHRDGRWIGAAGMASPFDGRVAGLLAGLTRTGIVVSARGRDSAGVTTLGTDETAAILSVRDTFLTPGVHELAIRGRRILAIAAPLGDVGTVVFTRVLDDELAVLPLLRRVALLCALGALLVALLLGALLSAALARPVRQLAGAASALGRGDFDAPLPRSRLQDIALVAGSFGDMRRALAARIVDLGTANVALADRSARLDALQSDLMQRERLDATGRIAVQLAHEIRNPVANVRNCLELIRRRVGDDAEAREFTDLAIDELLRMHELAEQMLDLARPRNGTLRLCRPFIVAREVARIATAGASSDALAIRIGGDERAEIAIAPDALKQVLLNLVRNAHEAAMGAPHELGASRAKAFVEITVARVDANVIVQVLDNGPGIAAATLPRIFDPFFTTKDAVQGVGLGLFVAEGLVRAAGGRLSAGNRDDRPGAYFRLELPAAQSPTERRGVNTALHVPEPVS